LSGLGRLSLEDDPEEKILRLLGVYENFPESYHGIIQFHHRTSVKRFQEIILRALHKLSREEDLNLKFIPDVSNCKVNLDFGVADGTAFNYLNPEVLDASLKTVLSAMLSTLDFICVVRYYQRDGEGYRPLKFDYYLLRFLFHDMGVDLQVFHERGTRRLSIEDLSAVIMERFDGELLKRKMPKISVDYTRTL